MTAYDGTKTWEGLPWQEFLRRTYSRPVALAHSRAVSVALVPILLPFVLQVLLGNAGARDVLRWAAVAAACVCLVGAFVGGAVAWRASERLELRDGMLIFSACLRSRRAPASAVCAAVQVVAVTSLGLHLRSWVLVDDKGSALLVLSDEVWAPETLAEIASTVGVETLQLGPLPVKDAARVLPGSVSRLVRLTS